MTRALLDFLSFREIVLDKMYGSECNVRRAIGIELRRIPRFEGTKAPIHYTEWLTWLHEAPLPIDQPTEYGLLGRNSKPRDLSNFVSTLAARGSGDKKLAAAFYYRLHMHLSDKSFATAVDLKAFNGRTFPEANNGRSVFSRAEKLVFSKARAADGSASRTESDLKEGLEDRLPTSQKSGQRRHSQLRLPRHEGGFFGRSDEIKSILEDLRSVEKKILVICAPGGNGKTALVEAVLNSMKRKQFETYNWIFEWSFYNQGVDQGLSSSDAFFEAIYAFLGMSFPPGPHADRAAPLSHRLSEDRGLLILDGLEPLQSAPGDRTGAIYDTELRRFLQRIQFSNSGCCIVTTRVSPTDISGQYKKSVSLYQLDNLRETDAVSMLQSIGVRGSTEQISEAARAVNCNPMTLRLLGNYLRLMHDGRAAMWRELDLLDEDAKQGNSIIKMLRQYSRWLEKSDNTVWSLVGFFRRPATRLETETLWNSLNVDLNQTEQQNSGELKRAIARLSELGLLYPPTSATYLDCHPVIRQYQRSLHDTTSEPWLKGHLALGNLLENSVEDKPSSLTEFLLTYDAVFHFASAGQLLYAWEKLVVPKLWQDDHVSTTVFGLLYAELETLKSFFEFPFTHSSTGLNLSQRAALGSQVAFILSSLNKLSAAMDIQAENYRLRSELGEWELANIAAGSAAEYGLIGGDLRRSVGFMSLAMRAARRLSSPRWRLAALCTAGAIRHEMGRPRLAKLHFDRALTLFQETRAIDEEFLGRASGFNLLWCLIDLLETDLWECLLRCNEPSGEALLTADRYLIWAEHCILQNENSLAPVPVYEAWFKLIRARLCGILQLNVGKIDHRSLLVDLEDAKRALQRANLARFVPLVFIVEMDCSIYLTLSRGEADVNLRSSVEEALRPAQELVQDGHLERYAGMLELRSARFQLVSSMLSGTRSSTRRYVLAARQLRLLGFKRLSNSLDEVISVLES